VLAVAAVAATSTLSIGLLYLLYARMILRFLTRVYEQSGDRRDLDAASRAIRSAGLAFPLPRRRSGDLDQRRLPPASLRSP
jgi:hypothetical protein